MFVRFLLPLIWAALLFIATCNLDSNPAAIWNHPFLIRFNPTPTFSDLLITSDIQPTDAFYLFHKVGHFIGFGLLYMLLLYGIRRYKASFILAAGFAGLTEILQLFFYRDGRLFDVLIDCSGIFLAFLLCKSLFSNIEKIRPNNEMDNQFID